MSNQIPREPIIEIYRLFDSMAQENVAAAYNLGVGNVEGLTAAINTVDRIADETEEKFDAILTPEERDADQ